MAAKYIKDDALLTDVHRITLQKCQHDIVRNVDVNYIIDACLQHGVITRQMLEEIRIEKTPSDKCRLFLGKLETRSIKAFNSFIHILKDDYSSIATAIGKQLRMETLDQASLMIRLANDIVPADLTTLHSEELKVTESKLKNIENEMQELMMKYNVKMTVATTAVPTEGSDTLRLKVTPKKYRPTSLKINILEELITIQNKPIAGYSAGSINSISGLPNGDYIMNVKNETDKTEKALLFGPRLEIKKTLVSENVSCVASMADMIAVSSTGNDFTVRLFDIKGNRIRDLKLPSIKKPMALVFNSKEELLIADEEKKFISCINISSGKVVDRTSCEMYKSSYSISVASDNNILIADCVGECVKLINTKGDLLSTYSGKGEYALLCPLGICVDNNGHIIIADYWKHNIQLLSPEGTFIKNLMSGKDGLRNPKSVVINNKGELVIGCANPAQVYVLKYLA